MAVDAGSVSAIDRQALRTILPGMKNITLSAEEGLIEQARATARAQQTTLNQLFRNWLGELAGRQERDQRLAALMTRLDYVQSGGPFTREVDTQATRRRDATATACRGTRQPL